MNYFALLFVIVAGYGCKKPNNTPAAAAGSGSSTIVSSTGSATAGSSTASNSAGSAVGGGSSTGSAVTESAASGSAAFDDKLDMPKQPQRSAADQQRVATAEKALRTALTAAKTASTGKALCAIFTPLNKAMADLVSVKAPKATDAKFADARDSLMQQFDAAGNYCSSPGQDPADAPADMLLMLLDKVRSRFIELVQIGA
jgi:hypothetical protein